ncbi:MAG: UvrD-helicase domain-containing protein [Magnetospirillum sp.]|nr:UvrD-helicase domain-containing protein [Magnetospirillum sp.]
MPARAGAAGPVAVPPDAPWLRGLNPEQHEAVTATEGPVLVLSGAGTGKTRVLTARLAHILASRRAQPWQILAVTFTNKAAREMRDRVTHLVGSVAEGVWMGTFHSVAVRILRRHAETVGLKSNFTILDADDQLRLLKQVMEAEQVDPKKWPPQALMGTVQRWKDRGLTWDKVGAGDGGEAAGGRALDIYRAYQERLLTLNACDFGDLLLHNLSIFLAQPEVLAHYQEQFRYLLVDEYQDTNVAQYLWLRLLAQKHRNICCVGDDDQCVAKGTLIAMADGSLKPVEEVAPGDRVLSSYGSGDLRAATVTRTFRRDAERPLVRLRTEGGRELLTTPEHNHFADIILDESPQRFFTYLMLKRGHGFRLGTSQVYTAGQRHSVIGYQQRCIQEHGDAVWLVRAFDNEQDARDLEHRLSLKYGITTFPFVARKGGSSNGLVHDQDRLDRLHRDLMLDARVSELMADFRLDPDAPHHIPRSEPGRRRNLTLTLNADRRGSAPMHRIAISGNDAEGASALAELGLSARRYKRNPANWRYETVFRDVNRLEALEALLATRFDLTVVRKANILGKALAVRQAKHVVSGMVVPADDGRHDVVVAVEPVAYAGEVFDLDVEGPHNFIANGIVTHNSIYSWRGAEVGNILRFERDFPGARVVRLERNYRSTPHILAAASHLIANNAGRLGKTLRSGFDHHGAVEKIRVQGVWDGEDEARTVVDAVEALQRAGESLASMAILVRAGFQTREFEERLITTGVPYRVIGGPRFYERAEIRDALAYLRLVVSPDDGLAFERIINLPKRGLGDAALQAIHATARAARLPLVEAARRLAETDELKPRPRKALAGFLADLDRWRSLLAGMAHWDLAATILDESGYVAMWRNDKSPDAPGRVENLEELVSALEEFDTLQGFLEHVALVMDNDAKADGDRVVLMTLHGAKGLEFDTVFLPGWEEGVFPHSRALGEGGGKGLEEERRLAYVGLTRARKRVSITFAASRRIYNKWQNSLPSRFLDELPPDHVERCAAPGLYAGGGGRRSDDGWGAAHAPASRRPPPVIEATSWTVPRREAAEGDFRTGDRVFHQKFGGGTVLAVDGDKLEIAFDKAGTKKVLDSFVSAV